MKGFMIYETPLWGNEENTVYLQEVKDASYTLKQIDSDITCYLEGTVTKEPITKARCNKDDTYDFETGALISLMKMCGVDKVVRACNEAFSEDTFKTYATKYERELNELKKDSDKVIDELIEEIKRLKKEKEQIIVAKNILYNKLKKENEELHKNIDELFESEQRSKTELGRLYFEKHRLEEKVEKLTLDCEKLQHGYNDNNILFCGGRQNGKQHKALVNMFKKIDQKKVDAAYKEAYNTILPVWQKEFFKQMCDIAENRKQSPTVDGFIIKTKPLTKREEMWENIFKLHKESDIIFEVKREDVNTFLHEIENKFPEITWASCTKIFETKYTIKDVYFELKTHDRVYFRLSRETKLSYSSDPDIYQYKELKHIDYLPPMRWDLFKKSRIAVKINYYNYKEFYEACEKELGKKPSTVFPEVYTVSICKKDGLFEVFTIEHQKKTGKKIVNWEDVR